MNHNLPRGSTLFSGVGLMLVGVLLLLHNYRGLELGSVFRYWWPLLLILWGAIKLVERATSSRFANPDAARISVREVFLVLGLLLLVGTVIAIDTARSKLANRLGFDIMNIGRESFSSVLEAPPMPSIPAGARIGILSGLGDITVRGSLQPQIAISGKKTVRAWNESDAERTAARVGVQVVQKGGAYFIARFGDSAAHIDMDVQVPKTSPLTIRSFRGDISVSDLAAALSIAPGIGDVEVRNTGDNVTVERRNGDVNVADTTGNVEISGRVGSIEVVHATGSLTINGDFIGPLRLKNIAQGVRIVTRRGELTLSHLSGHIEVNSGNLQIVDAPGNLDLQTYDEEIHVENVTGNIKIDNRHGNIELRLATAPKEDIEIDNQSADISLYLPASSSFAMVADCRSGDINSDFSSPGASKSVSQTGNSHLEGAFGKAASHAPRITLHDSYGLISIHKSK